MQWQPIETAPYNREVEVRVWRRKRPVRAILRPDASITDNEASCDQWQATTEDYPKNWCDGCCWESNSEGSMSDQPEEWRELPTPEAGESV